MTKRLAGLIAASAIALLLAGCAQKSVTPPVPLPPPPPRGEPDYYDGLVATRLRALLGSPAFIRKDGPMEMWRYDNANCHAFFFLDGTGSDQAVRHVETVPQGKGAAADPACMAALKKR